MILVLPIRLEELVKAAEKEHAMRQKMVSFNKMIWILL